MVDSVRMDIEEGARAMHALLPSSEDPLFEATAPATTSAPTSASEEDAVLGGGEGMSEHERLLRDELDEELRLIDRAVKTDPVRARLLLSLYHVRDSLFTRLHAYLDRRKELLGAWVMHSSPLELPTTSYLPATSERREMRRKLNMSAVGKSTLHLAQSQLQLEEFIGTLTGEYLRLQEGAAGPGGAPLVRPATVGRHKVPVQTHNSLDDVMILSERVEVMRAQMEALEQHSKAKIAELEEENLLLREPMSLDRLPTEQFMFIQIQDLRLQVETLTKERAALENSLTATKRDLESYRLARSELMAEAVRSRVDHVKHVTAMEDQIKDVVSKSNAQIKRLAALESSVQTITGSFKGAARDREALSQALEDAKVKAKADAEEAQRVISELHEKLALKEAALQRSHATHKDLYAVIRDLSGRLRVATGKDPAAAAAAAAASTPLHRLNLPALPQDPYATPQQSPQPPQQPHPPSASSPSRAAARARALDGDPKLPASLDLPRDQVLLAEQGRLAKERAAYQEANKALSQRVKELKAEVEALKKQKTLAE
jgi:hypothetical protein